MNQNGTNESIDRLTVGAGAEGRDLAMQLLQERDGNTQPHIIWLGGYRSDMTGTKAVELARFAARLGTGCIRFDYSGHGASGGAFVDGTISRWLEETLAVLEYARTRLGTQRLLVVGSSMGGWLALRLAQELRQRGRENDLAGMVLIAPAPDFTSELIEPNLTEAERTSLAERGFFEEPTPYGPDPNIYTLKLIEDGRRNRVLDGVINTGCPIHVLQGMEDPDVPYTHSIRLMEHLSCDDAVLTLVRDGDHRLSRQEDIEKLLEAVKHLLDAS
ncbi:alpha/beta hydrolase [Rhizobium sp. ARZ01]|uniref:alpha/beta hydrolase n=1 Tax=Rhizobium sp. ARZ01 TaxID=2769313 RepID=UPI0017873748|nr:alpha/beta hydrolase [Rhizobium sp. ARZ01]MBD9374374.1 alpha/beta hydrolase [Rhizobium sp. ARZ01]